MAMAALTGMFAAAACAVGGALLWPAPRWRAVASALMLAGLAVAGIA
jgi:hypothetical protein